MSLCVPAPLRADDPSPPIWQGVWQGTVGVLQVRACLAWDRVGPGDAFGAYYYRKRLRAIHLSQQGVSRVWTEGYAGSHAPPAPLWTFSEVSRNRLAGTWAGGGRALPFRLARIPDDGADGPCGSDAFNGPRWRPLTVRASPAVLGDVHYRRLRFDAGPAFPDIALEGFELLGNDAATRRLNAGLRAHVPGAEVDWRGCVTGGLDANGSDGDLAVTMTPTLITSRWLSAALTADTDCGGAHPSSGTTPVVYDRAAGREVDLHGWLGPAAVDWGESLPGLLPTLRPAFRGLLVRHAGHLDDDCRDAFVNEDFWHIGLDRRGLTFRPELPHAIAVCADDVLVPWAALTSYLTQAGREGSASLAMR